MGARPEGIRTSQRALGRLATQWNAVLDGVDSNLKGRVLRGRTLSRAGRVQQMEIAPGMALADVQDAGELHRPTVRVRTLDEAGWRKVIATLRSDLALLAQLVEGEVGQDLLDALAARGVPMVPTAGDIECDCDCGDWAVPCAHGAALYHVLGEALDGDPYLLFTLRGRTREQLEAALRKAWGDAGRRTVSRAPDAEASEAADPFASPVPPPPMTFRFSTNPGPPGMVALGPLAGDDDLLRALTPLYDAGAEAALALALADPRPGARRRRRSMVPTAAPRSEVPEVADEPSDLTERIVDLLASSDDGATAQELATRLGVSPKRARLELEELDRMGIVSRPGRDERWWLG
ncbi:MAG: hypothetical protein R3F59_03440 [Myxococcota bacterium]